MNESVDARVWREHECWREEHARLTIERARWTGDDWLAARIAADAAWNRHRSNLYLYDAERALREQHYERTRARLAVEHEHGVEWLTGVLERRTASR